MGCVDPELLDLASIGRDCDEVLGYRGATLRESGEGASALLMAASPYKRIATAHGSDLRRSRASAGAQFTLTEGLMLMGTKPKTH
jgi:hypothetical protein